MWTNGHSYLAGPDRNNHTAPYTYDHPSDRGERWYVSLGVMLVVVLAAASLVLLAVGGGK